MKKPNQITNSELDSLLNEAFLDLDSENNPVDRGAVELVARRTLSQTDFVSRLFGNKWDHLFLMIALLVFFTSVYRFTQIQKTQVTAPQISTLSKLPGNAPVRDPVAGTSTDIVAKKQDPIIFHATTGINKKNVSLHAVDRSESLSRAEPDSARSSQFLNDRALVPDNLNQISFAEVFAPRNPDEIEILLPAKKRRSKREITENSGAFEKKKIKKIHRKKSFLFHRTGTFIMKGGKYGKKKM